MSRGTSPRPLREPLTPRERAIIAGLMAGMAVAALDTTVVATALPTIVGEFEGLASYGWVFSAYLLASTTTVPLFAKLADMRGRKRLFVVGICLFVLGSILCGLSRSLGELIAFRAVQGLGAGAVQPLALTIVGDVFEPVRRARLQGWFSSVWGVSAIVGPALGGILTDTIGWRWVFYVNVPVGAIAIWLIVRSFDEQVQRRDHRIDWTGALLLAAGIGLVLVAVTEIGVDHGWSSPLFLAMTVTGLALLALFVVVERRVPEPVVDLGLVARPVVASILGMLALSGAVLFGVQSFVPPMVQGVRGGSASTAGAAVAVMSLGWSVASVIVGRWLPRTTSRPVLLAGGVCLTAGTALLTRTGSLPLGYTVVACVVAGFGLGFLNTTAIVTLQTSVPWEQRGAVTGFVQFSRTIGGAVGVAVLGAVLALQVGPDATVVLDPDQRGLLDAAELSRLAGGLGDALGGLYVVLAVLAAGALLLAILRAPRIRVDGSEEPAS